MLDKFIDLLISLFNDIKPIIFVLEYRKGILFRAGRYNKVLQPGWHFRIPFVDTFYTEIVMNDTMAIKEVNVTTLDGKTITVGAEFNLEVRDIYKAVVLTNDWRTNLVDISRGIISNQILSNNWENICDINLSNNVQKLIAVRAAKMGIHIWDFNFTDKVITRGFKLFN